MKKTAWVLASALCFAALPALTGCGEKTTEEHTDKKTDPNTGTTTMHKETTKVDSNTGEMKKDTETKVKPNDNAAATKATDPAK